MSDGDQSSRGFRATLVQLPLAWLLAAGVVLLAVALFSGMLGNLARLPATAVKGSTSALPPDNTLETLTELLRKGTDLTACRNVVQQLNAYQARHPDQAVPTLPQDEMRFLREQLNLDNAELSELNSASWTPLDAHHLEMCFLLNDTARSLRLAGQSDRVRASAAFAWVVRQIRFEPGDNELVPVQAVLRRSWGTDLQRTFVFLTLLAQLDIPGCLIGLSGRPWIPGALVDGEILLFDTRLGMPLPGADDRGIATLGQVRGQTEILQQFAAFNYDVASEHVKQAVIYLACPLSGLAPRMRHLQKLLAEAHPVRLTAEPHALETKFRDAAAQPNLSGIAIRFWNLPSQQSTPTKALRAFLPPEDGGSDQTRRKQPVFNSQLIAWQFLPDSVDKIPEEVALGSRLRFLFASPLLDFTLKPGMPRDLMLRGRLEEAVSRLVETLDATQQQQALARAEPKLGKQFAEWCGDALSAQGNVLSARRLADTQRTPANLAALQNAEQQMNDIWKKGQKKLEYLGTRVAEPLTAQASYLLALAKHEQAELAQAQYERRPEKAAQQEARQTWISARDRWQTYLSDYPSSSEETAVRLNLARALEALGDREAALALLEPAPAKLDGWNKSALAWRARQLKVR